jgi:nitroreductase
MRSAPQSRLFAAISWIKLIVSGEILGLFEDAFDLRFQNTRKSSRCQRRAQSSKNKQPWHFIALRDRTTLRQLAECGAYAGHLAGAPFAVALIASTANSFDLGQAAASMQLAAWDLGIGSCIASMWEPEKAKAILGVPRDLHFDVAISFGYPLPSHKQPSAPNTKGRKPFDEVVFWERWGG